MKTKVVFVASYFRPLYKKPGFLKAVLGSSHPGTALKTPEGYEQKGWSDCQIDGERLADDLNKAISKLEGEGFEVVSVTNITSGSYNSDFSSQDKSSYGWGYGFSYSEGVLITAKRQYAE